MHGLKTINQLNTLATENAPGAAQARIEAAEAVNKARGPSKFDIAYAEQKEKNRLERERALVNLLGRSSEELISLALGNSSFPSTLEAALARRLEDVITRLNKYESGELTAAPRVVHSTQD